MSLLAWNKYNINLMLNELDQARLLTHPHKADYPVSLQQLGLLADHFGILAQDGESLKDYIKRSSWTLSLSSQFADYSQSRDIYGEELYPRLISDYRNGRFALSRFWEKNMINYFWIPFFIVGIEGRVKAIQTSKTKHPRKKMQNGGLTKEQLDLFPEEVKIPFIISEDNNEKNLYHELVHVKQINRIDEFLHEAEAYVATSFYPEYDFGSDKDLAYHLQKVYGDSFISWTFWTPPKPLKAVRLVRDVEKKLEDIGDFAPYLRGRLQVNEFTNFMAMNNLEKWIYQQQGVRWDMIKRNYEMFRA